MNSRSKGKPDRTYIIRAEREQELQMRKLAPDEWLPAPVVFCKYRVVFTDRVGSGYLCNVFKEGCLLGQVRLSRWIEKGISGEGETRELRMKLALLDTCCLRLTEVEYDTPPRK